MKRSHQSLTKVFLAYFLLVLTIPGSIGFVLLSALNKWNDIFSIAGRTYGAAASGGLMLACVMTLAAAYVRNDKNENED